MEIAIILSSILLIIIDYIIAQEFQQIANQKGFNERKYFWYSFLLGFAGWIMVIALPDRKSSYIINQPQTNSKNDTLPEL